MSNNEIRNEEGVQQLHNNRSLHKHYANFCLSCNLAVDLDISGLTVGLLELHSDTLSPSPCGQGWGWRWVSGPVWREKRFGPLTGWEFWSSSAKDSGKEVQRIVGHCPEWSVGCCGRGASECPAPEVPLQFALA